MIRPPQSPAASGPTPLPDGVVRVSEPLGRLTYRLGEVARSLGVSRRTLERERSAGRFPPPDLTIGKAPLWTRETLVRWVGEGGGRP
jgi:hypothetical protein